MGGFVFDVKAIKRIATVGMLLTLLAAVSCGGGEKELPETVRPVKVIKISDGSWSSNEEYPGQVRASRRVDLAFQVSGPLISLSAKEGQVVSKGEVIARILPRDYETALNKAKAEALEAEQQFQRYRELYIQKQVSKADFDRYRAARDVALANEEDAKNALSDTRLRASFDGIIAVRFVENFEEVKAKQPIVSLQDLSSIEILVDLPERGMVFDGQRNVVVAVAQFPSSPGREFPLTLKEFSTQADPQTLTYRVVLEMEQPEDIRFLPGMTAKVIGRSEMKRDADEGFIIPAIAVVSDGAGGQFVWIVKEEDMTVHRIPVTVGELSGSTKIRITSGLSGGETVITAGMTRLMEGTKITIWNE
jgi:multidrug efflux system membrane fusion protein